MPAVDRNALALRLAEWAERHTAWQYLIPFDSPAETRDILERMVKAGEAKVCDIIRAEKPVGMLVFSVEELTAGRELVLVAAFSQNQEIDYTDLLSRFADLLASGLGCKSIRLHTLRPGLVRKAQALGYSTAEIILRKTLPPSCPLPAQNLPSQQT